MTRKQNTFRLRRAVVKIKNSINNSTSFYHLRHINNMIALLQNMYPGHQYDFGLCKQLLDQREILIGIRDK